MDGWVDRIRERTNVTCTFPNSSLSMNPARANSPLKVARKAGVGDRESKVWDTGVGPRQEGQEWGLGYGSLCVNK